MIGVTDSVPAAGTERIHYSSAGHSLFQWKFLVSWAGLPTTTATTTVARPIR